MTTPLVKEISKVDPYTFRVLWTDGLDQTLSLERLQQNCPCANCVEKKQTSSKVTAKRLYSVGRYAIRVEFTSGCSMGIYTFDHLRMLYGQ